MSFYGEVFAWTQRPGGPMTNKALKTITFHKTKSLSPTTDRLTHVPLKNHSLIAIRESATEWETQNLFHGNLANLAIPKFYSIISQNKKIHFFDKLSTPQRLFINFESFKWNELYFNFFKAFISNRTNEFIFSKILFQLDPKLAHYKTAVSKIGSMFLKTSDSNNETEPLDRWQAQTSLLSWILSVDATEELFHIFIFDLLLIAIDKENFSQSEGFVIQSESILLLNHFVKKELIQFAGDQIHIETAFLRETIKDYCNHQGRFLIAMESSPALGFKLTLLKKYFFNVESILHKKTFESCFFHS